MDSKPPYIAPNQSSSPTNSDIHSAPRPSSMNLLSKLSNAPINLIILSLNSYQNYRKRAHSARVQDKEWWLGVAQQASILSTTQALSAVWKPADDEPRETVLLEHRCNHRPFMSLSQVGSSFGGLDWDLRILIRSGWLG